MSVVEGGSLGGSDLVQCVSVASAVFGVSPSAISGDTVDGLGGGGHQPGLSLVSSDIHRCRTTVSSKGVVQSETDLLLDLDVRSDDIDVGICSSGRVERSNHGYEQAE